MGRFLIIGVGYIKGSTISCCDDLRVRAELGFTFILCEHVMLSWPFSNVICWSGKHILVKIYFSIFEIENSVLYGIDYKGLIQFKDA
jgi:hypothetical protein